ncbi:hypothetical protein GW17_00032854 [Ensete ventricosum]|nr:hypothetical protein GW17_00032854 [Ensete ventricosum]
MYWAVCTDLPADRYVDRPLPGGTIDWSCFRPITTRNRPLAADVGRYQPREGERRRGRRKPRVVLLFPCAIRLAVGGDGDDSSRVVSF